MPTDNAPGVISLYRCGPYHIDLVDKVGASIRTEPLDIHLAVNIAFTRFEVPVNATILAAEKVEFFTTIALRPRKTSAALWRIFGITSGIVFHPRDTAKSIGMRTPP